MVSIGRLGNGSYGHFESYWVDNIELLFPLIFNSSLKTLRCELFNTDFRIILAWSMNIVTGIFHYSDVCWK